MNKKSHDVLGLVVSDIFPPRIGGSGAWLWEVHKRQPHAQYAMLVGMARGFKELDAEYPQPIVREDLNMASRGMLSFRGLKDYWRQARLIQKSVRQFRPRMIYAARPLNEGLACRVASLMTGVPYACYVHGEDVNVAKTSRDLSMATNIVLRNAKALIANSTFTKGLLVNEWNVPDDRVVLMNPGVDTARFSGDGIASPESVDGGLHLMTAGRLQKRKGHDTVIKSIPELLKTFKNLKYTIAGSGEEADHLRQLAADLNVAQHVVFAGEVSNDELVALYHQCDVFVLANRTVGNDVEGFGIVLLEAQAAGKPVIAGRSGGTCDTMIDGKTGFLVDATSETELIQCLTENLRTDAQRRTIGEAAKRHVRSTFDWENLAKIASDRFHSITAI